MSINVGSTAGLLHSLRKLQGVLVTNITGNVFGHAISEIDNYARLRISREISPEIPCFLFADIDKIISDILDLFPGIFEVTSLDPIHKRFSDHIVNCHPDLSLDVGLSSYKTSPPERGYEYGEILENMIFYRTGFINGIYSDTIKYFKRIKATQDAHPLRLKQSCPDELQNFLTKSGKPIVVLQQRKVMSAGTKVIASDDLYIPAIEYLKDKNYSIVFSGREEFPKDWHKYGVIDYANSTLASPKNDFHLYRIAKFGLLAASGTNFLAETQCLPYVQINSSQGAVPTYSKNSIILPSIWRDNESLKMISASHHIGNNLIYGVGVTPNMIMKSVTSEDILNATQELEELIESWNPRSDLQNKWIQAGAKVWEGKALVNGKTIWSTINDQPWIGGNTELLNGKNEESLLTLAESRVSQKFLESNYEDLFGKA